MTQHPASGIAVTGVTGAVGGGVARRLAAAGVDQRMLARSPDRAPRLDGARVVAASFGDGAAVRAALAGTSTVLMVSAAESSDRVGEHRTFVEAAVEAGVEHLVYVSFVGASADSTFLLGRDHGATEAVIAATGVRSTFLRDNLYADFLPVLVGDDGVIRGPAGDGRFAAVARSDVADAAAAVLLAPAEHAAPVYDLTGPAAVTMTEAAATISAATGRPVRFQDETPEQARASRAASGAPDWLVEAWISTYTAIAAGDLAAVSPDVERLTGHPATPLERVLGAPAGTGA